MPTIEQRYEGALAALTEMEHLALRLAGAVAAHDPDAKRTLNGLCRDHLSALFRVGGDDASVKTIIEELERSWATSLDWANPSFPPSRNTCVGCAI